jgi:hypothetical protein
VAVGSGLLVPGAVEVQVAGNETCQVQVQYYS